MLQKLQIAEHREAVARAEAKLAQAKRDLNVAADPARRADLQRCISTLEAMLPVYRQMERFVAALSRDVVDAD